MVHLLSLSTGHSKLICLKWDVQVAYLFLMVLKAGEATIKVPADLLPDESLLPGWWMGRLVTVPHMAFLQCLLLEKDLSLLRRALIPSRESPLNASSRPLYLPKASSPNTIHWGNPP